MIRTETVRYNNDQTIIHNGIEFYVEQRKEGFVHNDHAWIVTQLPEYYWSNIGVLRSRRDGKFLGVFCTIAAAEKAIRKAELMPINDRRVV